MNRKERKKFSKNKRGGFSFFIVSIFILLFSIGYVYFGDGFFPARDVFGDEIYVSFLDVGQGDSILVRTAGNAVLIDGGEFRARGVVLEYLRGAGVERLDFVVATHPHSDHIGGLITVLRDFDIGTVVMPDVVNNTDTFENFLEAIENNAIDVIFPVAGDRLVAGIIEMTVVSPGELSGINNSSIVLRMEYGETAFLFTGDAENSAERWMLDNVDNLSANVLKIGHHGSRTSTGEEFLAAVNPAIAVISASANNQFGHPHPEIISRLESRGIEIFRTSERGTIRMVTNGKSIYR
jgi:beta-lactamase superfamily II metal-dependent hydrolase